MSAALRYAVHRRRRTTDPVTKYADHLRKVAPADELPILVNRLRGMAEPLLLTVRLSPGHTLLWRAGYAPVRATIIFQAGNAAKRFGAEVVIVAAESDEELHRARVIP